MLNKSKKGLIIAIAVLFGLPVLNFVFLRGGLLEFRRLKSELLLNIEIGKVKGYDYAGQSFEPAKQMNKVIAVSFLNPSSEFFQKNLQILLRYQQQFKFKEDMIHVTHIIDLPDFKMDTMVNRLGILYPKWKFLKLPLDGLDGTRIQYGVTDSLMTGNNISNLLLLIDRQHKLRNVYFIDQETSLKKWVEHSAFVQAPDPSGKRR